MRRVKMLCAILTILASITLVPTQAGAKEVETVAIKSGETIYGSPDYYGEAYSVTIGSKGELVVSLETVDTVKIKVENEKGTEWMPLDYYAEVEEQAEVGNAWYGYYLTRTGRDKKANAKGVFIYEVWPGEYTITVSSTGANPVVMKMNATFPSTQTITATPNSSTVLVDGKAVVFDAYTIDQNNYFKLRDLAKVLSGTEKQFEVTWDGTKNAINMASGKPYSVVGGEMAQGDGISKTAQLNTSIVYLNGEPIQLTAYTINQNNYFKLRDLGTVFDFDVTWDGVNNQIVIDTAKSYTDD